MKSEDPDARVARILTRLLATLNERECEALGRFYLLDHTAEQIQRDLGIGADQLRELKVRIRAAWFETDRTQ